MKTKFAKEMKCKCIVKGEKKEVYGAYMGRRGRCRTE